MAELERRALRSFSRPRPVQIAAGLAVVALAVVTPAVSEAIAARAGVRALALGLLAGSALSALATRRAAPADLAPRAPELAPLFGVVAGALLTGGDVWLRLVPAAMQVALAGVFLRSLGSGGSLFERVAFALQPHAPDFIRPYCRASTRLWVGLFAANAAAIAALAILASPEAWRAFASWGVWLEMGALALLDVAVRKLYFRIYDDGPLDRWLARAFPAEATEMGRRSNAYRLAKRGELGYPLPRRNA